MENTIFNFDQPSLGISEEQFDGLEQKAVFIEKAIDDLVHNSSTISFANLLQLIVTSDLTRDDLSFVLSSIIFNDFFKTYNESIVMDEDLHTEN